MIKDIEPDRDDPTYCAKCDKNHSIHYDCTFGATIGNKNYPINEREREINEREYVRAWNAVWNAAIEEAASVGLTELTDADRIRSLKK